MLHITYILYMAWGWHGLVTMQQQNMSLYVRHRLRYFSLQRDTNDTSRNQKSTRVSLAVVTFLY